jgi:uncharacterized protein involved in type VI secretion and phage assembly
MAVVRFIVLIALCIGFTACKQRSNLEQAKALINEGNALIAQDSDLTNQWTNRYKLEFNPDNLAKFPANRDSLRIQAEKLMSLFDQCSSLSRMAAEKYDQASRFSNNANEKRGVALFASALRKNVEVNQLYKSQMKLFSDESIKDQKTLKEKLRHSWEVINLKRDEGQREFDEGRRLLGI